MWTGQRVEETFAVALDRFSTDPWLHVFIAQYARYYRKNEYVEMLHLDTAAVRMSFAA